MRRDFVKKSFLLSMAGILFLVAVFGVNYFYKFYDDIFRLSFSQIQETLSTKTSSCKNIADCELVEGDILIRRYITERTWLVDKLAHPFFTHSAFYLGNDQIVEAVGKEKYPEDDIRIAILSKSDWLNSDVYDFVIIRPKNYLSKLDIIKSNLKNIAEDSEYTFGLSKQGYKRATCADLIFQQLFSENIVKISKVPKIITPDYLFSVAINNPEDFRIVGFNLQK